MSDALSQQQRGGRRSSFAVIVWRMGGGKFSELDEAFPAESAVVVNALKLVFDHDERGAGPRAECRRSAWPTTSEIVARIMKRSRRWLEQQTAQRLRRAQ